VRWKTACDVVDKWGSETLRHALAHFILLKQHMDVYTLAKQIGTSVKMMRFTMDIYSHHRRLI
jgi:hypothetical protein